MAEIKWIKLSTTMFDDDKIKLIESMPDADTILIIWIKLLTQAGKCNTTGYLLLNNKIPFTEDMMVTLFRRPIATIRLALQIFMDFGMIDVEDETFHITNWEKHQNLDALEKIRDDNRRRKQEQRLREKEAKKLLLEEKNSQNENVSRDKSCDVTNEESDMSHEVTQQNKNKNKNKNKEYINNIDQNSENENPQSSNDDQNLLNNFFESAWSKYPNKVGKTKVSLTQRKKLYKIGDELFRCIDRYLSDKNLTIHGGWKELQGGDRFFNKTYLEYTDSEFESKEVNTVKKKYNFAN